MKPHAVAAAHEHTSTSKGEQRSFTSVWQHLSLADASPAISAVQSRCTWSQGIGLARHVAAICTCERFELDKC
jgi:hypothetical protein